MKKIFISIKDQDRKPSNQDELKIKNERKDEENQNQSINFMPVSSIKRPVQTICNVIVLNQQSTEVFVGDDKQILVYDLFEGHLQEKQKLQGQSFIKTLCYMKKMNLLISGGQVDFLIVWVKNENGEWFSQQKLIGHKNNVNCIIANELENTIISCSYYCSIKFWMKQKQWICTQSIEYQVSSFIGLSLSESNNYLVSVLAPSTICVFEKRQQWNKFQNINVHNKGVKVCFIGDNMIVFQSLKYAMEIFIFDQLNRIFIYFKSVKIAEEIIDLYKCPLQFNKMRQIFLNKEGKKLNLFRIKNNQFLLDQVIQFENQLVYACLSQDGELLIVYDHSNQTIDIRKQEKSI